MKVVVFSDIDDTLIAAKSACPNDAVLQPAGERSSSYTTQHQRSLIELFSAHELIPVTGRNKAGLDRINIPFKSFKVVSHGAVVLDANDELLPDWVKYIQELSQLWLPILNQYNADINAFIDQERLSVRCRVISDFGFPCYLSIKGEVGDLSRLDNFSSSFCALGDNARVHLNGGNMALLPPYACKKLAVEFLQKQYLAAEEGVLFLAAGDSCSDLPYMNSCDFSLIPQRSQITQERL
ncbi:hypothetical protein [Leucothrix arctica]|uniref:Sucrose phosphatase-like domain-containing protein n=1 Tax=Leucothrix arctica TaxID=1481894 RepID=A0A317CJ32_9GAMM|nr:hypothetical protein [Leucothrix arctica]PWQ98564.1 hypothetical protein DKT75_03680 [Leucothrix arctica]